MIPRSMDVQNRAQDLAATVLSSTTAPQIAAACSAVESFLQRHASDQSRSFFSITFPSLICRLFGFDASSPIPSSSLSSWIDLAADPDLASKLFDLLSPQGLLFSSISSVDRHSLVKYVFPSERLPEWIRFVLQNHKNIANVADLCPLLKSRVKNNQIHLNVFEYYMFWFAYYPVCKGNSENSDAGLVSKNRRFRLENWTSSLPSLVSSGRKVGQKPESNLYLRLLYSYLRAFVPKCGLGSYLPYRSSLLHYSSSFDSSAYSQAEFLVYTLIHFWMVDNDFSPLPVSICRSFGVSFPFRNVLGETPPTAGLGEVVTLLVKYLNCNAVAPTDGNTLQKISGSGEMVSYENSVASWNSVLQRPLYRFILRTFLFAPMGTSIKNAAQVFSLWVTYMAPWEISQEDFLEFDAPRVQKSDSSRNEKLSAERKSHDRRVKSVYSPMWESYVGSNYLFYSSLVVHFLGFAHKFLHTNVETVVQMVLKVLKILTSSTELMDLLQRVDAAYHSKPAGSVTSVHNNVHKYIPLIREQLKDWEDGLCESDADGSFLHDNWNCDLRLFSDGEDGGPKLLQLFVLRAEHEIQTTSGDLKDIDSIRSQMKVLFGSSIRASHFPAPHEELHDLHHGRGEVFTPKHPGVGKRRWADVKYKGDWMRRPISDSEVAWLARLLIRLSDWLNEALGLDRVDSIDSRSLTYVEVNHDEGNIGGPREAIAMVVYLVGSWLGLCVQAVVRFMRGHGMRINLRVLASKKFVMLLLVYAVFCVLKRALWAASNRGRCISK